MQDPLYAMHSVGGPGVGPGIVVPAGENRLSDELIRLQCERDRWKIHHDRERDERKALQADRDRMECKLLVMADELEWVQAENVRLRAERDAAETKLFWMTAANKDLTRTLAMFDPEGE